MEYKQGDRKVKPTTGSACEKDIAIAMPQFSWKFTFDKPETCALQQEFSHDSQSSLISSHEIIHRKHSWCSGVPVFYSHLSRCLRFIFIWFQGMHTKVVTTSLIRVHYPKNNAYNHKMNTGFFTSISFKELLYLGSETTSCHWVATTSILAPWHLTGASDFEFGEHQKISCFFTWV